MKSTRRTINQIPIKAKTVILEAVQIDESGIDNLKSLLDTESENVAFSKTYNGHYDIVISYPRKTNIFNMSALRMLQPLFAGQDFGVRFK